MAEMTILGVVTESVLTKAFSLASEEISRLLRVNKDLETLRERVGMIQALLSDAARKDPGSSAVRLWLKRLRAVAADADHLLDRIAYEGLRKKIEKGMLNKVSQKGILNKVSHCFTSSKPVAFRCMMANRIKEINLTLDKVFVESSQIGLRAIDVTNNYSSEIRSGRITHPFVDDSEIVGRKNDIEKILRRLTCSEDENNLSVIGIVGMAGQGKTAIAQLIYKSKNVSNYFGKRIWVCVSEDFKVEKILNEMLQTLTGEKSELTLRVPLVEKLKKELSKKMKEELSNNRKEDREEELSNNRLLLILDDVWNKNKKLWECMEECLGEICGANGCRILVTTRSEGVLSTMQASFTHPLGTLSGDYSCKLFEKFAFADGGASKTPEMVDIGKRIVKKCGGVPLAIKTLGGLMYSKKSEQEWLEIEENKIWSSSDDSESVLSAIKLSYDHLPLSLKQCFAFCSIYTKDSVLGKERLVELWMAQGFLNPPPEGSQSDMERSQLDMEGIGRNYFDALLQVSLLQDAQVNDYGEIVSCKMHDLVHDFALQLSKGYCLNMEGGVVENNSTAVHLLIRSNRMVKMSKERLQKVRTLILEDCGFAQINLVECKRLRVLVVRDWSIGNLPSSIGQLKHLRHLDIVNTSIESLPGTITKLYHLQTLRVGRRLEKFPEDFGNMLNLRHVYIPGTGYGHVPQLPRIENLTSLRTINYFQVSQDGKSQIEEVSNLQNLGGEVEIHGLENVSNKGEAKKAKLSDKKNIVCLELHWYFDWDNPRKGCNDKTVLEGLEPHSNLKVLIVVGFAGESLPPWMLSQRQPIALRNLVKITLSKFPNCKNLPPLGHLPSLKFVAIEFMESLKCIGSKFYGFSYLENAATSSSQTARTASSIVAFPSLQNLQLTSLDECKQWLDPGLHQSPFSFKLFPHLKELRVSFCNELNCIPHILTNLVSLEVLEIRYCRNLISIPSIGGMRSLRELKIEGCNKLAALSSGLEACTSLQKLSVSFCDELSFIPDILTSLVSLEELTIYSCNNLISIPSIGGLRSLQYLNIEYCPNLVALPNGLEACTSLQKLRLSLYSSLIQSLSSVPNLRELELRPGDEGTDSDCFPWPSTSSSTTASGTEHGILKHSNFDSLEYLLLDGSNSSKIKSLPEQIQHLPVLRKLNLYRFPSMEALPEWLGNIHSLQILKVWDCYKLAYLPIAEKMQRLTRLEIIDCPILRERCRKEGGPEWHKIAHILDIDFPIF